MWAGSVGLGRPGLQRSLEVRKNLVGICGMERSPLSLEDAEGGEDRDGEKEEPLEGLMLLWGAVGASIIITLAQCSFPMRLCLH